MTFVNATSVLPCRLALPFEEPFTIRNRIFDPFFTTRLVRPQRGTGRLAICQAITTTHGGTLMFESEVGRESTLRLDLPAAPVEA